MKRDEEDGYWSLLRSDVVTGHDMYVELMYSCVIYRHRMCEVQKDACGCIFAVVGARKRREGREGA